MRRVSLILVFLSIPFLTGCIADQNGKIDQTATVQIKDLVKDVLSSLPTPTVNVPPNQVVDTSKLREDIRTDIKASSDNNAAQMSGAINANVGKLANEITGVKAELGKLLEINNNLYIQLNSNITNSLTASANVSAELKSNIQAVSKITAELEAKVSLVADIKTQLEANLKLTNEMNAEVKANASVLAGIGNRVDNFNSSAGHDVNMLPMSAVYLVTGVLLIISIVITIAISLSFKSSGDKAHIAAKESEDERRRLYSLLIKAMAFMPEKQANVIAKDLNAPGIHGDMNANQTSTP